MPTILFTGAPTSLSNRSPLFLPVSDEEIAASAPPGAWYVSPFIIDRAAIIQRIGILRPPTYLRGGSPVASEHGGNKMRRWLSPLAVAFMSRSCIHQFPSIVARLAAIAVRISDPATLQSL
jgi:hypothetical protein